MWTNSGQIFESLNMIESSIKRKLFGGEVEIVVFNIEEPLAKDILESVYEEGLNLQKVFNFYDEDSELSKLNTERRLKVSSQLLEVINTALKFCELTHGEYDISLGKAIVQRKFGKKDLSVSCNYKDIIVKDDVITLAHEDVMVDLGSIAKGYIADKMADYMKSLGVMSGIIDARGDIVVFGEAEQQIDIQHPRITDKKLKSIRLKNTCVATSGDYMQYAHDYEHSHILHKKDIISATVVAPSLMIADVYASVLFVSKERLKIMSLKIMNMSDASGIKAMTVDNNMNIEYYNGFENLSKL